MKKLFLNSNIGVSKENETDPRRKRAEEIPLIKDVHTKFQKYLESVINTAQEGKQLGQLLMEFSKKVGCLDPLDDIPNYTTLAQIYIQLGRMLHGLEELNSQMANHISEFSMSKLQKSMSEMKQKEGTGGGIGSLRRRNSFGSGNFIKKYTLAKFELVDVAYIYAQAISQFLQKGSELLNIYLPEIMKEREVAEKRREEVKMYFEKEAREQLFREITNLNITSQNSFDSSDSSKTRIFGEPLAKIVEREGKVIPEVVLKTIKFIEENCMNEEGLFRVSVNKKDVVSLQEQLDNGTFDYSTLKNAHLACSLLKNYLRSLPEPLIVSSMFPTFIALNKELPNKKVKKCKELVNQLPIPNVFLLDYVIQFCNKVSSNSEANKMTVKNLASLIAPTILYNKNALSHTLLEEITHANSIVELLIENYEEIFEDIQYDLKPTFYSFNRKESIEETDFPSNNSANSPSSISIQTPSPSSEKRIDMNELKISIEEIKRQEEKMEEKPKSRSRSLNFPSQVDEIISPTPELLSRRRSSNEKTEGSSPNSPRRAPGALYYHKIIQQEDENSTNELNESPSKSVEIVEGVTRARRLSASSRSRHREKTQGEGKQERSASEERNYTGRDKTESSGHKRRHSSHKHTHRSRKKINRCSALTNLSMTSEEEFNEAMDQIFNKTNSTGWVLIGYSSLYQLRMDGCGNGTVEEMAVYLRDDAIQYAVVRIPIKNQPRLSSEMNESIPTKDIFLYWMGPTVSPLEKGKKKAHAAEIRELLHPFHVELSVFSKEKLTTERVLTLSEATSGSHIID